MRRLSRDDVVKTVDRADEVTIAQIIGTGATVARVHVRFAGNDEGDWGAPLLGTALFAEVDWR